MYNKIAEKTALFFVSRNLITVDRIPWCKYTLIRWLSTLQLYLILLIIALLLGRYLELLCFCFSLLSLRRRMGGWHAKKAWVCQLLSVFAPLICVYLLGPFIERVPFGVTVAWCFLINTAAFILKPVYPPQTHFDENIRTANDRKKRWLLILIVAIQIISIPLIGWNVMIYCSLGISVVLLSLVAEVGKQKYEGGLKNEKVGRISEEKGELRN